MIFRALLAAALAASTLIASQASAESYTTRIEPRAYYGAVVSLEQGVRVWRPLPPTRHMIINPDGRTPLSLNVEDVRQTVTNNTYNNGSAGAPNGNGYYGAPGYYYGGRDFRRHRHHGRRPVRGLNPR